MLGTTETPRRDVTLANGIALLGKIKNQLPDTSHRQLAQITGMPKSTIASVV
jgi:DNA-binding IclR family transcriptional regulator